MSKIAVYLGDGVYAYFDGTHVVLTTEDGSAGAANTIYLEREVIKSLLQFLDVTEY